MLHRNPDYRVILLNTDANLRVEANIPEAFFLSVSSEWAPRMGSSLRSFLQNSVGGGAGSAAQGALWLTNFDIVVQSLTFQSWESSAPIEFNLTLLFDAYSDGYVDVVKPMSELQSIALPYASQESEDILLPPGPSPIEPDRSRISLRIGRLIYIHSVVLKNVNNTFDTRMDANGQPISGQSEITVATINTPSRQDVSTFYVRTAGANTAYGVREGIGPGAR